MVEALVMPDHADIGQVVEPPQALQTVSDQAVHATPNTKLAMSLQLMINQWSGPCPCTPQEL